jgi:hypothetical protein
LKEKVVAPVYKSEINGRGVRRADNTTLPYPQKLALKFADRRRSSVGIVRLRTKRHRVCFVLWRIGGGKV